ncbi:MAG: hypothetical protein ACI91B_002849 [Planctomycetota bacterium]
MLHQKVLAIRRRVLGDDPPNTLVSLVNLGLFTEKREKLPESEALCREAVTRCRRVHGDQYTVTLSAIHCFARTLQKQGRLVEAEVSRRESFAGFRLVLGDNHANTKITRGSLVKLLGEKGGVALADVRLSDAETAFLEAHELAVVLGRETAAQIAGKLVIVYEQWQEREPDKGHAARAESWRTK